ncbi:hypothetical protein FGSG_06773 [Fusarium graminearum PH-1]|uniref:hypothetical protein n=1 Tax=Gibberella zeae (strain ATCC MYA-4620 / CBS 123657 / FGSC 9075 / NRRL 31084 / PH-1) TaxID=229533 RepID=UPI000023CC8B|nr:hypothetical protein FGSG_06773 [Fusarium graminearum PH-1]ESU12915.1 hypothetical protein FGSG_06773 [Fusarium graminearum PH-1]EYB28238.1 hypothetical protein FG05_06773 [Fusarium graminearum]|eukprot:XP_011326422.1 hypothetical protein FGSG_06773 [Fusarium graminearum PH-1]
MAKQGDQAAAMIGSMHSKTEPSPWNWLAHSCKEVLRIQWLVGGLSTNNAVSGILGRLASNLTECEKCCSPRLRVHGDLANRVNIAPLQSTLVQYPYLQHWRGEVRVADDVSSARDELLPTL